jgi:hypothetical protein
MDEASYNKRPEDFTPRDPCRRHYIEDGLALAQQGADMAQHHPPFPDRQGRLQHQLVSGWWDGRKLLFNSWSRRARSTTGRVSDEEIKQFRDEAISGDYSKLAQVCMAWVDVG